MSTSLYKWFFDSDDEEVIKEKLEREQNKKLRKKLKRLGETFTKPVKVKRTCNRVRIVTETPDEETKIRFVRYPCEHGVSDRGFLCKMCKGNGLCRHEKQKQRCKDCKEEALMLVNTEEAKCKELEADVFVEIVELDNNDTLPTPTATSITSLTTILNDATTTNSPATISTNATTAATVTAAAADDDTTTIIPATTSNEQVTLGESNKCNNYS